MRLCTSPRVLASVLLSIVCLGLAGCGVGRVLSNAAYDLQHLELGRLNPFSDDLPPVRVEGATVAEVIAALPDVLPEDTGSQGAAAPVVAEAGHAAAGVTSAAPSSIGDSVAVPRSSAALGQAAAEQERRVARAADRTRDESVVARIDTLAAQLDQQQVALRALSDRALWRTGSVDAAQWSLATDEERQQLTRLDRVQTTLTQLVERQAGTTASEKYAGAPSPTWSVARRVQRLRGVLAYRIADAAAARIWQHEKLRRAAGARLDRIDLRGARIAQAEHERKGNTGAGQQVIRLQERLQVLATRASQLRDEREKLLTAGLRARITADRSDSEQQLAYARLAMARIADAALTAAHRGAH